MQFRNFNWRKSYSPFELLQLMWIAFQFLVLFGFHYILFINQSVFCSMNLGSSLQLINRLLECTSFVFLLTVIIPIAHNCMWSMVITFLIAICILSYLLWSFNLYFESSSDKYSSVTPNSSWWLWYWARTTCFNV